MKVRESLIVKELSVSIETHCKHLENHLYDIVIFEILYGPCDNNHRNARNGHNAQTETKKLKTFCYGFKSFDIIASSNRPFLHCRVPKEIYYTI